MCRTSRHRRLRCRVTKLSQCRLTCQPRYSTRRRREVGAQSAGIQEKISQYSEQGLRHSKTLYGRGYLLEIEPGQHSYSLSLRSILSHHTFPIPVAIFCMETPYLGLGLARTERFFAAVADCFLAVRTDGKGTRVLTFCPRCGAVRVCTTQARGIRSVTTYFTTIL